MIIPEGYLTLTEAAASRSISLSTLRRRIRPHGDAVVCALWARRLDIRQRQRPGNLMPVFYLSTIRLQTWAHALTGIGMPLIDPALSDDEQADGDDDA